MAENQNDRSREDLTEEASPYRIEEYRKRGVVSQSKELSALAAFCAAAVATWILAPKIGSEMADFMREVFRTDLSSRVNLGSTGIARSFFMKAIYLMAGMALPICVAGFIFGILSSFAQVGSIFSFDPITPDLNKINPISGIQKLISIRQGLDGIKMIFKMIVVIAVSYFLVKREILGSSQYIGVEPSAHFGAYGHAAKSILLSLVGVLLVFSVIDFFLQRWEYAKNLRMTKQEAKQEHKEREGDPMLKARIRAVQREMARKRMMQAVKKADVVITNPTHIAIAIAYDKDKMMAPKVIAKGADLIAQRIKKVAAEAGIPMVENVPLARTLYKSVKIGQYVPRALYQAVAEVLAYVYRLKNRRF